MDLQHWQAQFENWLKNHHQHQDAAHDVCHFRRVWATAQKLAADDDVDMLVILTACYFHDIVSLAKNHPQRQRSSILAAEETRRLLREEFEQFPAEKIEAVCHAIAAHSFSAQIAPLTAEAKEGANKQVISSQADSLIKISRIWADFFPQTHRISLFRLFFPPFLALFPVFTEISPTDVSFGPPETGWPG